VHFVGLFLSSLLKMHGPKNKMDEQARGKSSSIFSIFISFSLSTLNALRFLVAILN